MTSMAMVRPTSIQQLTTLTPSSIGGLKIVKVIDRLPHFNMLVYGKSGVGKTFLSGSSWFVPEMRNVLFVDIEGGILTLRKDFPLIDTVRVETWQDMQSVYDALFAGGHGYKTVIVDSGTEAQKFNMSEIMRQLVARKPERDPDVPDMREWGKNLEQIRRFVRAFRDLLMNVIFTALEREDKDKMLRPVRLPSFSGKMAGEIAAFFDIVAYYYVAEVEENGKTKQMRVLQTRATESTTAKDRSGLLPAAMVNPTMEGLYDLIIRQTGGTMKAKEAPKESPPVEWSAPTSKDDEIPVEDKATEEGTQPTKPMKLPPPTDEEIASLTA